MAISSFERGKKYTFDIDLLRQFNWENTFLPVKYLKLKFNNNVEYELYGWFYIAFATAITHGQELAIHKNRSDDFRSFAEFYLDQSVLKSIVVIFDYSSSPYSTGLNLSNLYSSAILYNSNNLVAIYDAHNSNWIDLPCPSDYSGISTTLVDSARNTQGQVIGNVIASDIAKVEMKWKFLTPQQYSNMAKLFEQKYNGSFFVAVSFFDIIKNDFDGDRTKAPTNSSGNNPCRMFYCGDRKVQFAKMVLNEDGTPKGYADVALNLIDTGKYYGE